GNVTVTNYRFDPDNPNSLGPGNVTSILEDRSGNLWVGTGRSLNRFRPETGDFDRYVSNVLNPFDLPSSSIQAIMEDRSGNLWFGTVRGMVRYDPKTKTSQLFQNNPDKSSSLPQNFVRKIHQGYSGNIWVVSDSNFFSKLDVNTGTFTHFPLSGSTGRLSQANRIQAIYEDRDGLVWLGIFGDGLVRFDPKKKIFRYFLEKDGLPNNVVYGILEDNNGYLWISTNNGLSRFDRRSGMFKNYTRKDGLQSNEFNSEAYFKSPNGEMFFGGVDGISAFKPEQLKDNLHVPSIVITDFQVSNTSVKVGPNSLLNKHITETDAITLSYKENVFSFEFVALDFIIPEKNSYAYMMEGFDRDWNYTTSKKRFASYTNLDPGDYTFRVIGSNNDGVWNKEGTSIRIT
ncbi:MAG: histidine kinase, partial [bacterium]|nr:histidine kinase [bacterium]